MYRWSLFSFRGPGFKFIILYNCSWSLIVRAIMTWGEFVRRVTRLSSTRHPLVIRSQLAWQGDQICERINQNVAQAVFGQIWSPCLGIQNEFLRECHPMTSGWRADNMSYELASVCTYMCSVCIETNFCYIFFYLFSPTYYTLAAL
jgi:hypothetical protein